MTATAPASTIVVIGREAFQPWEATLRRIVRHTTPIRVVVIDGGSPRSVHRRIVELAEAHDFTLVRSDAVLAANESRNLAMRHVHTEFVVFVDNDTLVRDGWLDGLERCARETGAGIVSPAVLWGPTGSEEVHFAGGTCHLADEQGVRRLETRNVRMHQAPESLTELSREPTELAELHCVLIRTAALRDIDPFDETLTAAHDEHDLSLRLATAGYTSWLEPAVVVEYPHPKRLRLSDRLYYMPRWSDTWSERSYRSFNAKWRVTDTVTDAEFRAGHKARRVGRWPGAGHGWRGRARRATYKVRRGIDLLTTPLAARLQDRRRAQAAPPRVVRRASWDLDEAEARTGRR